jgi:hypothetical protein
MLYTGGLPMKPEPRDSYLLAITRSKAKLFEYRIPQEAHINLPRDPKLLLELTIGILGDAVATGEMGEASLDYVNNPLLFSAHYFDALQNSRLTPDHSEYLKLIASTAYNLCDIPGSASVLAASIANNLDLEARGLERVLLALVRGDTHIFDEEDEDESPYSRLLSRLQNGFESLMTSGTGEAECRKLADQISTIAYRGGSDRELLLGDAVAAMVRKRLDRSIWLRMPTYSTLAVEQWRPIFMRENCIRELWPSQILLGEAGVFNGKSAVVQMPTSAGKTKSMEFVIRSGFISGRARFCVIVAPFRALCHEINHSLAKQLEPDGIEVGVASDVMQEDVEVTEEPSVLILTPEKLDYLLRHNAEMALRVDMLIFDEAHLLDDPSRGVPYELLLSSLKIKVRKDSQKILISAVATNAEDIRIWFLGDEGATVTGGAVLPTYRTVGFTSWQSDRGQIRFVDPSIPRNEQFFVPGVINRIRLTRRGRESKVRFFPERGDQNDVALYLACRLMRNGGVAIFCGTKATAAKFAGRILEVIDRDGLVDTPASVCNPEELQRLVYLHERNLGSDEKITRAMAAGLALHHGNTPQGLRLAIEHALESRLISLVACTSTLAQGVNLPIRYLLLTGIHQAGKRLKVRDFHNLMGRAGRAGIYTEGSVIFANPDLYDKRDANRKGRHQWDDSATLLNPENSEPCRSAILRLTSPFTHRFSGHGFAYIPAIILTRRLFENEDASDEMASELMTDYPFTRNEKRTDVLSYLLSEISNREQVLKKIEEFLLQLGAGVELQEMLQQTLELFENTLAVSQSDQGERAQLKLVFEYLAERTVDLTPDPERRAAFSKTILNADDCEELLVMMRDAESALRNANGNENLLACLWPMLRRFSTNTTFRNCVDGPALDAGNAWIQGHSFAVVLNHISSGGNRIGRFIPNIGHAVNLAEGGFGYEGSLIVGAVVELLPLADLEYQVDEELLATFQKSLKYGLPDQRSIEIYELGFADRVLAQELAETLPEAGSTPRSLRRNETAVRSVLEQYPAYFRRRADEFYSTDN